MMVRKQTCACLTLSSCKVSQEACVQMGTRQRFTLKLVLQRDNYVCSVFSLCFPTYIFEYINCAHDTQKVSF